MDGRHFDALARHARTRRTALGGVLAGLLLPLDTAPRAKGKKGGRKGKGQNRASAQIETCWRTGACIPRKGSNVSRCDLEDSAAFFQLNCTGCNVSRANLRGADLRGSILTRANLSGACLLDADFTGAIFTNTTNLANAIFCNTAMPNGSINSSSCAEGTACCPTCAFMCGAGCVGCYTLANGSVMCGRASAANCTLPCTTNADCPELSPTCLSTTTLRTNNQTVSVPQQCGRTSPGMCARIEPCAAV